MNKITITQRIRTWLPIEYYVKDVISNENTLYAIHNWSRKGGIDVYQVVGKNKEKLFSIKARNIFTFTYSVTSSNSEILGFLALEDWSSQSWLVTDVLSGTEAHLARTFTSVHEEYRLISNGQEVCIFTKGKLPSSSLNLQCADEPKLSISLILSIGIVLLAADRGGDAVGAG